MCVVVPTVAPAASPSVFGCAYRPNQIGVSRCRLLAADGLDIHVRGLDAIDGTPILDVRNLRHHGGDPEIAGRGGDGVGSAE
jgi:tRNA (Thr-GGU) A37 N-methylase